MLLRNKFFSVIVWAGLPSVLAGSALAQSSDQALPTPIFSNEISGKIAPLDLGDPRLTRHFYAFEGTPGDLLITVNSKNLNGDLDVFTAITFRPLMKTTLYANVQAQEITKGIYLRTRQILILRVEARTPNDDPGAYRIRLGGSFAKFSGGIPVAESIESTETATEKPNGNILSSVGATIPRPVTEAKTAEAKPGPEKTTDATEAAKPAGEKPAATSRRTGRTPRRGSRGTSRRTPPTKTETTAKSETETAKPAKEGEAKAPETTEKSKTQEAVAPPAGAHLIIERKDGTRIDRPMATVRRVIIEGGTIVIVLKTGKIERLPMSEIARMAIEPQ